MYFQSGVNTEKVELLYISTFNLAPNRYTFAQSYHYTLCTHVVLAHAWPIWLIDCQICLANWKKKWFRFLITLFLGEKSCWSRCSCCTIWFTINIRLWRKQFDNWRSLFDWFRARYGRFRSRCKFILPNIIYRLSLERSKVKWREFLWILSVDILCH